MPDVYEFPAGHQVARLSCDEVEDALAAYAWGGLEPAERERVDRHRRECAACDQRLLASERVVSELDQAGPRTPAPPELRGRVLEAIAGLERAPGAPLAQAMVDVRPGDVARAGVGTGNIQALPMRRAGPGLFIAGLATGAVGLAAAAALVLLFLVRPEALGFIGASGAQFGSSDQPGRTPGLSLPWQAPAPSTRLLELRSSSAPGRGLLAFDAETRRGVLLLEGVSTSAGPDYAVWLVSGTRRVQVGSLAVDAAGVGSFVLPDPLPLERPERIEVSPATGGAGAALSAAF